MPRMFICGIYAKELLNVRTRLIYSKQVIKAYRMCNPANGMNDRKRYREISYNCAEGHSERAV